MLFRKKSEVMACKCPSSYKLRIPEKVVTVHKNDWLIIDEMGRVSAVSDEQFRQNYERVSPAANETLHNFNIQYTVFDPELNKTVKKTSKGSSRNLASFVIAFLNVNPYVERIECVTLIDSTFEAGDPDMVI